MAARTKSSILLAAAIGLAAPALAQPKSPPTQPPKPDVPPAKAPAATPGTLNTVDLRPKFRPNQQTRYSMIIESTNKVKSLSLPEMDQDQTMKQEFGLLMRVVEVGTDSSTVELVYESLKMKIKSDTMTAEFDSTRPKKPNQPPAKTTPPPSTKPTPARPHNTPRNQPPANPPANSPPASSPGTGLPGGGLADMDDNEMLAASLQGVVGTVVTMKIDANGNITSVSGTGSIVPNSSIPGGGLGGLGGGLGGGGGNGAGSWLVSSPGQSGLARVGETWRNTDKLGLTPIGDFSMITEHTLRSASAGQAVIAFNGRIDQGSAAGGAAPDTFQIRSGRYRGQYIWDTDNGQLRDMDSEQLIDLDGKPMGTDMTMSSKQTVKIKRIR